MDSLPVIASLLCPLAILVTLGYALVCAVSPFGPCRRCSGTGKRRSLAGRIVRPCPRCDGTGRRIRIGRHLANDIRQEHRNGTR